MRWNDMNTEKLAGLEIPIAFYDIVLFTSQTFSDEIRVRGFLSATRSHTF